MGPRPRQPASRGWDRARRRRQSNLVGAGGGAASLTRSRARARAAAGPRRACIRAPIASRCSVWHHGLTRGGSSGRPAACERAVMGAALLGEREACAACGAQRHGNAAWDRPPPPSDSRSVAAAFPHTYSLLLLADDLQWPRPDVSCSSLTARALPRPSSAPRAPPLAPSGRCSRQATPNSDPDAPGCRFLPVTAAIPRGQAANRGRPHGARGRPPGGPQGGHGGTGGAQYGVRAGWSRRRRRSAPKLGVARCRCTLLAACAALRRFCTPLRRPRCALAIHTHLHPRCALAAAASRRRRRRRSTPRSRTTSGAPR